MLVVRPQPGHAATCGVKLRRFERLQNLLADDHFFGAVAIRQRSKRGANGIADALLQQDRKRGGRGDDAFRAEARFRQAEMQRIIAARRQHLGTRRSDPARR